MYRSILFVHALLSLALWLWTAPALATDSSFARLWPSFQQSVRAADPASLSKLARFPVSAHGEDDDAKVQKLDRPAFEKRVPALLAQDSGMAAEPQTMRDYILSLPDQKVAKLGANGATVRVGAFVFEKTANGWALTKVYEQRTD